MEYTPEQKDSIRVEFHKRREKRLKLFYIALGLLIISAAFLFPLMNILDIPKLAWAPAIYMAMFIILILIAYTWRCPACESHLGDVFKTKYCNNCGIQLVDDRHTDSDNQINKV